MSVTSATPDRCPACGSDDIRTGEGEARGRPVFLTHCGACGRVGMDCPAGDPGPVDVTALLYKVLAGRVLRQQMEYPQVRPDGGVDWRQGP